MSASRLHAFRLMLVIFLMPLCLASCIYYRNPATLSNPDRAEKLQFPGLREELNVQPVVNVLIVHGMGTHDGTYADGFLEKVRKRANLHVQSSRTLADRMATPYGAYSSVQRITYQNEKGHELRVFILTWSKLTEIFEDQLLAYDWQYHAGERVRVNRDLKRYLIDTSFDDAVMFSGTYAPVMRAAVERAICVVVTNKNKPDEPCRPPTMHGDISGAAPIFLITHSLGSVMVIETLERMLPSCPSGSERAQGDPSRDTSLLAREFVGRLRGVFLLANQLPLLYLARIPAEPAKAVGTLPNQPTDDLVISDAANSFLKDLCSITLLVRGLAAPIPIIAFSDPNDLLTFPLPGGWRDRIAPETADRLDVINVTLNNAHTRWFGIVVNPSRAHTGYWASDTVVGYVVNGNRDTSNVRQ